MTMGNIREILGEKKFSGGKNRALKFTFEPEQPIQLENEGIKFNNVVAEEQFELEKRVSTKYKFHGKLQVDVSLNYYKKLSRSPNRADFTPNDSNWQFMLLQPTPVFDGLGNKYKGVKNVKFTYGGKSLTFDFNKGLPLFRISPWLDRGREFIGFISVLGHDFEQDQIIKLEGLDYEDIEDGEYRIVNVDGKNIYINKTQSRTIDIEFVNGVEIVEPTDTDVSSLYDNQPVIYGSRVVDGQTCEYYVKNLKVISDVTDELNNCAFSKDIWGNQAHTYQQPTSINLVGQMDNIDRPVIDLYFGAFKRSISDNFVFTSVDSNFKIFAPKTKDGSGLEKIYEDVDNTINLPPNTAFLPNRFDNADLHAGPLPVTNDTTTTTASVSLPDAISATPLNVPIEPYINRSQNEEKISYELEDINVGDEFMSELVEYDPVNLKEVKIHGVWHTMQFTASDQRHRFAYNPFTHLPLKVESTYVESSVSHDGAPDHAKFDPKYQTYRWRDILDNGFYEDDGNGLDHIYLNGAHYIQNDISIQVVNYSSAVYDFLTGERLSGRASDIIGGEFDNIDPDGNNTFDEYQGIIC